MDKPDEPYRCADGWESPSIGEQGACSHHGGVVGGDATPWYVPPLAIGAGGFILALLVGKFGLFRVPEVGPFTDWLPRW